MGNPFHARPAPPKPTGRYVDGQLVEDNGIRHIGGCHGTGGCRCEGYRDLNPQLFPATRYVARLTSALEYLVDSSDQVRRALDSGDTDALHAAAQAAFDEAVKRRGAVMPAEMTFATQARADLPHGHPFFEWDARVTTLLGVLTNSGFR